MAQADEVIAMAAHYLGVKENGDNNVIFNTMYYGREVDGKNYPWCVVFLWCMFTLSGHGNLFYGGRKCAYAPALKKWFTDQGQLSDVPRRGDVVFIDFNHDGNPDHAGLVTGITTDGVTTIEGNTDDGRVAEKVRRNADICGFGRPAYIDEFIPYAAKVHVSDYLNVRIGPGVDFPILEHCNGELFRLPPDIEIAIVEESKGWGRINNINGWVSLNYLRRS